MKIILKRGQLDGQTDQNVPENCLIYRRSAVSPIARYRDSGLTDSNGFRIFEHWPPNPDGLEPTEGVHDA